MRVLLIEDEEHIREVAQFGLQRVAGWDVLLAAGGIDGVEIASTEAPDVILLDVMMPGIDGPTTFRRLQAIPTVAGIPIIFLTGKALPSEQQQLLDLGAVGVIQKPFSPKRLAAQVQDILEGAR